MTNRIEDFTEATIIRIEIEPDESGLLFATSPDLFGLLVSQPDLASLQREVPKVIKAMFEAKGQAVAVHPAKRQAAFGPVPWVAIPTTVVDEPMQA